MMLSVIHVLQFIIGLFHKYSKLRKQTFFKTVFNSKFNENLTVIPTFPDTLIISLTHSMSTVYSDFRVVIFFTLIFFTEKGEILNHQSKKCLFDNVKPAVTRLKLNCHKESNVISISRNSFSIAQARVLIKFLLQHVPVMGQSL